MDGVSSVESISESKDLISPDDAVDSKDVEKEDDEEEDKEGEEEVDGILSGSAMDVGKIIP